MKLTIHEKINSSSWFSPHSKLLRAYRNRPMLGIDEMKEQSVSLNKSYAHYPKKKIFTYKF